MDKDSADVRVEPLRKALEWYANVMCEGFCKDKDPKICAAIGQDNCAGCPAVIALAEAATPSPDSTQEQLYYSREDVQDAVQRLLERGRAYINAEGYLSLANGDEK